MHCAHACFPAPARAIRTAHFSHKKCVARFGYLAQVNRWNLPVIGRLSRIESWEDLTRSAGFRPVVMAVLCGVSLRQLERFFLETFGITPGEWSRNLRCRLARQLISEGWSSKAVASELRYASSSHLCQEFKKAFGAPPQVFAPTHQRGSDVAFLR